MCTVEADAGTEPPIPYFGEGETLDSIWDGTLAVLGVEVGSMISVNLGRELGKQFILKEKNQLRREPLIMRVPPNQQLNITLHRRHMHSRTLPFNRRSIAVKVRVLRGAEGHTSVRTVPEHDAEITQDGEEPSGEFQSAEPTDIMTYEARFRQEKEQWDLNRRKMPRTSAEWCFTVVGTIVLQFRMSEQPIPTLGLERRDLTAEQWAVSDLFTWYCASKFLRTFIEEGHFLPPCALAPLSVDMLDLTRKPLKPTKVPQRSQITIGALNEISRRHILEGVFRPHDPKIDPPVKLSMPAQHEKRKRTVTGRYVFNARRLNSMTKPISNNSMDCCQSLSRLRGGIYSGQDVKGAFLTVRVDPNLGLYQVVSFPRGDMIPQRTSLGWEVLPTIFHSLLAPPMSRHCCTEQYAEGWAKRMLVAGRQYVNPVTTIREAIH
jgi:hypothetical protein